MNWHKVMWWIHRWGMIMYHSSAIQYTQEYDDEPDSHQNSWDMEQE